MNEQAGVRCFHSLTPREVGNSEGCLRGKSPGLLGKQKQTPQNQKSPSNCSWVPTRGLGPLIGERGSTDLLHSLHSANHILHVETMLLKVNFHTGLVLSGRGLCAGVILARSYCQGANLDPGVTQSPYNVSFVQTSNNNLNSPKVFIIYVTFYLLFYFKFFIF